MKVNLAAQVCITIIYITVHMYHIYHAYGFSICMQVLSASVSSALALTGKEEFEETSKFCRMFDKFFDCLNTRRAGEGKQKRKPDLDPYRSDKDFRFEVCSWCVVYYCTVCMYFVI